MRLTIASLAVLLALSAMGVANGATPPPRKLFRGYMQTCVMVDYQVECIRLQTSDLFATKAACLAHMKQSVAVMDRELKAAIPGVQVFPNTTCKAVEPPRPARELEA